MEIVASAIDSENWHKMKEAIDIIKAGSIKLGASMLYSTCCSIEKAFMMKDYVGMISFYPLLVETALELKMQSSTILQEYQSNQ